MRLYRMELYKLMHGKFFLAGLPVILAVLLLYFAFVNVGDERAVVNGKVYTGYEAVRENREITKEFTGPLDDETAEQIIEKYGFPSQVEEYYGGFRDENYLNGFVTEYLGNGYMRSWDDYKVSTELIPVAQTDLGRAAETSGKEIILCYTKGWSVLLDTLQLGMILGSVLILVSVSPVFAEERQCRMSALLFTSEEGRDRDVTAKIAAAFTLTAAVYAAVVLSVFLSVGAVYGLEGGNCMTGIVAGSLNPVSTVTMKPVLSFVLLSLGADALALMSLCAVVLCVSAHYETLFYTVAVSGIVWMMPLLIRIMFDGLGYVVMCGTPLFLVMTGVLMDIYSILFIPAAVGTATLIFCTMNGRRTYMLSEGGR